MVEEHVTACAHVAPPLSAAHLAQLTKQFADAIPDEGFSIAVLQGCEYPMACSCGTPTSFKGPPANLSFAFAMYCTL